MPNIRYVVHRGLYRPSHDGHSGHFFRRRVWDMILCDVKLPNKEQS